MNNLLIDCLCFDIHSYSAFYQRKHFAGELAENMLVRFIFNGRELRHDASTLQSCNITDGSVIHCLLTRGAQPEENVNQQAQVLNLTDYLKVRIPNMLYNHLTNTLTSVMT